MLFRKVELVRVVNDPPKIFYKCKGIGCPWGIRAREVVLGGIMNVTTYNSEHTCNRVENNVEARVKWIVRTFEGFIRSSPTIDIDTHVTLWQRDYKVTVKRKVLYKVMARVRRKVRAEHSDCFLFLRQYCVMVQRTNPGSTALVRSIGDPPQFSRMFVCFAVQGETFEHYRSFIGLDSCHLKGPYEGVLLTSVTLEANSGGLPLVAGIVDLEKKDT